MTDPTAWDALRLLGEKTVNDFGVDMTLIRPGVQVLLADVLNAVGVVGTVIRMDRPRLGVVEFEPVVRAIFHAHNVMDVSGG